MNARGIVAIIAACLAAPAWAGTQTRTSAFEYDPVSGQLTKEIIEPGDPNLCLVTTYTYDTYGNRASATTRNCNGSSSESAAPAAGAPAVITTRTSYSTYAAGSVLINGVTYNWSAGQFATSSTNALGKSESKQFDPRFGGVASLTGPNDITTTWTYDSFGRKSSEVRADTTTSTSTYNLCTAGVCPANGVYYITVASTGAPTSSTYYDSLNRPLRSETQGFDGTLVRKDTQYDTLGRVAQVSKPYLVGQTTYWTTFTTYDTLNRAVVVTEPATDAGALTTTYNYNGLTTSVSVNTSPVQTKTTVKNSQGQVATVTDPQGNTVTYSYDPFGNFLQTNAGGVITTLGYDLRGRKISMNDPDMGAWIYAYDVLGELVSQTDAKGQTATTTYDVLGRMIGRTEPDLVSTWIYDNCTKGIGKLCSESATNNFSRSYTYDSLGRPATLNAVIDITYNVTTAYVTSGPHIGKLDTVTYPLTGFGVRNVYNTYGYLSQVKVANPTGSSSFDVDGTLLWQANAKSASGQITNETLGNNLVQTRTFDALDRLRGIGAGSVVGFNYSYDIGGNLTQRTDSVQSVTENFSYDILNRLTLASGANLVTRSFNYDALGNMTYKSDAGTYAYPAIGTAHPHAVASVSGTVNSSYSYDANGNLMSGGGRTLTYASFNMPATISGTGATYTYTYSPEHERVKLVTQLATGTQTSIYLHPGGSGGALFYEKEIKPDTSLEHKHYVQAGAQLVGVYVIKSSYQSGDGPGMRYYHRDHLGSVVAITNQAGAILERLAYEAYGKRRFPNGTADPSCSIFGITTDRGFTAHEHLDELCLVHMNGRVYDPTLGRFMTADPFIQSPDNLQSYNRYSYVVNNPLGYTDPTGYHHHWKHQIAHITQSIMKVAGSNKYLGGLIQMGLLTHPFGFGAAYGWSTGDWKTVGRGYETMTVMAATWYLGAEFGVLGQMAGGGINGYLQTGNSTGALRGMAAGAIPDDLGLSDLYKTSAAANIAIGIVRDGIRGDIVSGSRDGIAKGIVLGQANNAIGHVYGFLASGFSSPDFVDGKFIYHQAYKGAVTFGNVITGNDAFLKNPVEGIPDKVTLDHELGHVPQATALGALYVPANVLGMLSGMALSGHWDAEGAHSRYNPLECSLNPVPASATSCQ